MHPHTTNARVPLRLGREDLVVGQEGIADDNWRVSGALAEISLEPRGDAGVGARIGEAGGDGEIVISGADALEGRGGDGGLRGAELLSGTVEAVVGTSERDARAGVGDVGKDAVRGIKAETSTRLVGY